MTRWLTPQLNATPTRRSLNFSVVPLGTPNCTDGSLSAPSVHNGACWQVRRSSACACVRVRQSGPEARARRAVLGGHDRPHRGLPCPEHVRRALQLLVHGTFARPLPALPPAPPLTVHGAPSDAVPHPDRGRPAQRLERLLLPVEHVRRRRRAPGWLALAEPPPRRAQLHIDVGAIHDDFGQLLPPSRRLRAGPPSAGPPARPPHGQHSLPMPAARRCLSSWKCSKTQRSQRPRRSLSSGRGPTSRHVRGAPARLRRAVLTSHSRYHFAHRGGREHSGGRPYHAGQHCG